jgi:hypothetical protein
MKSVTGIEALTSGAGKDERMRRVDATFCLEAAAVVFSASFCRYTSRLELHGAPSPHILRKGQPPLSMA